MTDDAEAERVRALMLLVATLNTVLDRLDEARLEDLGLIVRITELQELARHDLLASRPGASSQP